MMLGAGFEPPFTQPPAQKERKPLFAGLIAQHEGLAEELAEQPVDEQVLHACISYLVHGDANFDGLHQGLVNYFKELAAQPKSKPMTNYQIAKLLDSVRMQWVRSPPTYEAATAFVRAVESYHNIRYDS